MGPALPDLFLFLYGSPCIRTTAKLLVYIFGGLNKIQYYCVLK